MFYNEPPENMVNIDGNRPREAASRITLDGSMGTVRSEELATLRTMLAGVGLVTRPRTIHEEMDLLKQHRDAILFALERLPKSTQTAGVANALTWAVVARAWYCAPLAYLERFCEVLRTGIASNDDEGPILLLWKSLAGNRGRGLPRDARQKRYGTIQRALAAYLDGESLAVLRPIYGELFLLSAETTTPVAG